MTMPDSSESKPPQDLYSILGVDFEASEEAIRKAYMRLALRWHPDKHGGSDEAKSKFQDICQAYHVLSDPKMRQEYNETALFDVDGFNLEEFLKRFKQFILTANGLGLHSANEPGSAQVY
mmetsp:Transcript_4098/g.14662  ORF Transcript_4098/g.14662 Transcript_4098/m.14662 type:complete len:120 (+) Transcript_4098:295-654(+)